MSATSEQSAFHSLHRVTAFAEFFSFRLFMTFKWARNVYPNEWPFTTAKTISEYIYLVTWGTAMSHTHHHRVPPNLQLRPSLDYNSRIVTEQYISHMAEPHLPLSPKHHRAPFIAEPCSSSQESHSLCQLRHAHLIAESCSQTEPKPPPQLSHLAIWLSSLTHLSNWATTILPV
jgi:hypothetical protein